MSYVIWAAPKLDLSYHNFEFFPFQVEAETIQQSKLKKSATAQNKSKVPTASKTTVSSRRKSMIVNAKTETNLVPRTPITITARRTRRSVAAGMVISPVQEITTNNIPERISEEVTETPLEAAAEVTKDSEANLEVCGETVEVVMSQSSVTVVDVAAVLPELNVIVEAPLIEQKPAIDSPLLSETQLSSVKKTPARGRRSEPMTRVLERSEKKTPARSRKSAVVKPEDEMKEMTEQKSEKKKTPARVRKSAIMKLPDKGEGCPVMEITEAMPKEKKKTPGRPRKSTTIAGVNQAKPSSADKVSNQPKMMAIKSKKSANNSRTPTDVTSVLEAESETNKSVEQASTKSPGRPRKSEIVADKKLSATKPKMMAISSKRTLPNPTTVALTAAENITPELSDVKTPEVKSQKRRSTTKVATVATPAEKVSKKTDTGTKRRKPTPNRLMAVKRNAGVLDMSMGDNSMMFMTPDGKSQAKRDFSNTPYHTPGKPGKRTISCDPILNKYVSSLSYEYIWYNSASPTKEIN